MFDEPGYDFNETALSNSNIFSIRKKSDISIDECSRLCLNEPSFECKSMTYTNWLKDCKWSSVDANDLPIQNWSYFLKQEGVNLFTSMTKKNLPKRM